jgi:Lipoate-protein ligase A
MTYIYIDQQTFNQETLFHPFAFTDVFTEDSSSNQHSFLHFWQFEQTFILGMKDTRVNYFDQGIKNIQQNHYVPVIRNSGGLGVIADQGVLNISLIFPKTEAMTTDAAYEWMSQITAQAFPELNIEAYEIVDSYCPGTFDLSVDGKKIAGIAQRRSKQGIAVMMYLSVNGDQEQRGAVVREFYRAGLKEHFDTDGYPAVDPTCMTTLADLLQQPLTIDAVKQRFLNVLAINQPATNPLSWITTNHYTDLFERKLASMAQRNQQIKELGDDDSV